MNTAMVWPTGAPTMFLRRRSNCARNLVSNAEIGGGETNLNGAASDRRVCLCGEPHGHGRKTFSRQRSEPLSHQNRLAAVTKTGVRSRLSPSLCSNAERTHLPGGPHRMVLAQRRESSSSSACMRTMSGVVTTCYATLDQHPAPTQHTHGTAYIHRRDPIRGRQRTSWLRLPRYELVLRHQQRIVKHLNPKLL
jgi:hypothetical protein